MIKLGFKPPFKCSGKLSNSEDNHDNIRPTGFCYLPAAQLLQLLKILWRGSAVGLSLTSALLQLYAFSCPVVYAMANNFPLLYVCI